MELVKNKVSGKYFIVLEDDIGDDSLVLITPEGKIKPLERRLFDPMFTANDKKSKWHAYLTNEQMRKYSEYGELSGLISFGT